MVFSETTPAFRRATCASAQTHGCIPPKCPATNTAPPARRCSHAVTLDHLAISADSPDAFTALRERLSDRGATDGTIEDLGAFHSLWFADPDGMRAERVLIVDPQLDGIHALTPLPAA